MHNSLILAIALMATASISACSTQLTRQGSNVNLVTASSADRCDVVKIFVVQGSTPDEALRIAFNESAKLGANSMAVAGERDTANGAEINGAALTCPH